MCDSKQTKAQVDELKAKGNAALGEGNIEKAIILYTKAIELDPSSEILYSNRSAAFCKSKKYVEALDDADRVIELKKEWPKGYSRKGAALSYLNRHEEAMMVYMEGINYDPSNAQLKEGIREAKTHLTGPSGSQPLVNPFGDPQLWKKIENDSRTKEYLSDPEYKVMISQLQKNPKALSQYMNDARVMTTLGMLLGVDLNVMEANDDSPERMDTSSPPPWPSVNHKTPAPKEPVNEALSEKEQGNAAYKKKDFETALEHYGRAIELDPTNMVFRNNRAAVYFEQGEYDQCIKECEEAVDIGRENRADFKVLAKALARLGTTYHKKEDFKSCLFYYNKSLSEYRDQDLVKKVVQIEKEVKEKERLAYFDIDRSLEEKKLGNDFFLKGDYPSAIKHYTEAIKRNSDDAKVYSNRAACYTKLAEFTMALRDCDKCIKLDPAFIKGYLRKGASLLAIKEHAKAGESYQRALEIDSKCQEAIDGYRKCVLEENDPEAVKKRAMQDPEVQQILGDPAMQIILQQMQKDPKALQEHLSNPQIAKKIEKLLEVGLIAIR